MVHFFLLCFGIVIALPPTMFRRMPECGDNSDLVPTLHPKVFHGLFFSENTSIEPSSTVGSHHVSEDEFSDCSFRSLP